MRRRLTLVLIVVSAFTASVTATAAAPITYKDVKYPDLRGMTITVPQGWKDAQTLGEFGVVAPNWKNSSGTGARVDFLADPYGTEGGHGGRNPPLLPNVHTPAQLVSFLLQNPKLVATRIASRRIDGQVALGVDLHTSLDAGKEDPHCATACWSYIRFEHGCCTGTDANTYVRIYFASIGRAINRHVLMVFTQGDPRAAFAAALPTAERIVSSVRLPPRLR